MHDEWRLGSEVRGVLGQHRIHAGRRQEEKEGMKGRKDGCTVACMIQGRDMFSHNNRAQTLTFFIN